jgi:N-acetylglucosamine kinase-like BadF-type ATPase
MTDGIRPLIRRDDLERWMTEGGGDPDRMAALAAAELERRAAAGDEYARHVLDRAIRLGVEAAIEAEIKGEDR